MRLLDTKTIGDGLASLTYELVWQVHLAGGRQRQRSEKPDARRHRAGIRDSGSTASDKKA